MATIWPSVKCMQVIALEGHQLAQVPHPLQSDELIRETKTRASISISSGAWNWQMSTHSPHPLHRISSTTATVGSSLTFSCAKNTDALAAAADACATLS